MRETEKNPSDDGLTAPTSTDAPQRKPRRTFGLVALALVLLTGGLGLGARHLFFGRSGLDRGMAEIERAFAARRPFESRIAGLGYAPLPKTRGDGESSVDQEALRRARLYFLENRDDPRFDRNWGILNLADRKTDEALGALRQAASNAPADARLQNDLGAAYFEKAKTLEDAATGAAQLENIDAALSCFDRAAVLDPELPEPLFNRALVLERKGLQNQARETWRVYVERYKADAWTDEARTHLDALAAPPAENLAADALEAAFLDAFRQRDEARAWRLLSENRELIKRRYLPQKLAMSLAATDDAAARDELLQALAYAGELERKNIGDRFAAGLAVYYRALPPAARAAVKDAQTAVQNSYRLYLEGNDIDDSYTEAVRARDLFLKAGDEAEAKLCDFLIVYCLIKKSGYESSLKVSETLAAECRRRDYKWLLANTLYWLGAAQRSIGDRRGAFVSYQDCLALAREIRDAQITQKILIAFAKQNKFVGRHREALGFLEEALAVARGAAQPSLRERWRSYSEGTEILAAAGLFSLARAVAFENLALAGEAGDLSFTASSELDAGALSVRTSDPDAARQWLDRARADAAEIPDNSDRTEILAKSLLLLGGLARKSGDQTAAAGYYEQARAVVERDEHPFFLYEIEKGRLLTEIARAPDVDRKPQIDEIVALAEKYRQQIATEQERSSFFNDRQDIYDLAVANEFKQSRTATAYDYLESSNARSLLNWLKKGVVVKKDKEAIELTFNGDSAPLASDAIRAQTPPGVQLLQYAVLDDGVLIWVLTRDDFRVARVPVAFDGLRDKVDRFIRSVSDRSPDKQDEARRLSRELYELLIAPVAGWLDPAKAICIVPQKFLFHLPFAALSAPDDRPLVAAYDLFYAPSANAFLLSTENARQKTNGAVETLLSVGNPRFDPETFRDFEDLREAEGEARAITEWYGPAARLLTGGAATKENVSAALADADVIDFAGHYIVRPGEPLASGLLLTTPRGAQTPDDSILTNAELIGRKMPRVRLVVLSACRTGVEQYYNGEGLVGLSRTFLAAGAPLVVASQWAVDSEATAVLIKRFHALRKQEHLSTTRALRQAQLEMSETPGGRFDRPFYWAAFAVYGGYAEF